MEHYWLTDEQFARIAPLLPNDTLGRERVDDRRVISGIVHVLKSGGRWTYAPRELSPRFLHARIEAVNRAEATALLICCGYCVYGPKADIEGEDLVVPTLAGELLVVQLKSRLNVDWRRYGGWGLLMLFSSAPYSSAASRTSFMLPHDAFYAWVLARHGHAKGWTEVWSYPGIS